MTLFLYFITSLITRHCNFHLLDLFSPPQTIPSVPLNARSEFLIGMNCGFVVFVVVFVCIYSFIILRI